MLKDSGHWDFAPGFQNQYKGISIDSQINKVTNKPNYFKVFLINDRRTF